MSNQDSNAIVSLVQKKDDLLAYVEQKGVEIWKLAPEHLKFGGESAREKFFNRLAGQLSSDTKLAECFQTPQGKMSIVQLMNDATEYGVMIGTEAYAIPYKRTVKSGGKDVKVSEAKLFMKAEAYRKILISEPTPLFADVDWAIVYENDSVIIDEAAGEVSHKTHIGKGGRGEIIGVWVRFTPIEGEGKRTIVKYWDIERINKVRDNFSTAWKSYIESESLYNNCMAEKIAGAQKIQNSGNVYFKIPGAGYNGGDKYVNKPTPTPWHTSPEQMMIKTVLKAESKPYAIIKPALERALEIEAEKQEDAKYDDIASAAEDLIDNNADKMGAGTVIDADYTEPEQPEPEPEPENNGWL